MRSRYLVCANLEPNSFFRDSSTPYHLITLLATTCSTPPSSAWYGLHQRNGRRWVHMVLQMDSGRARMYVDAQPIFDRDYSGPDFLLEMPAVYAADTSVLDVVLGDPEHLPHRVNILLPSPCYMALDGEADGVCEAFHFLVDRVAVYDYALTAAQVEKHFFGIYDVTIGISECTTCPGGHECPNRGMDVPDACPAGEFRYVCGVIQSTCCKVSCESQMPRETPVVGARCGSSSTVCMTDRCRCTATDALQPSSEVVRSMRRERKARCECARKAERRCVGPD